MTDAGTGTRNERSESFRFLTRRLDNALELALSRPHGPTELYGLAVLGTARYQTRCPSVRRQITRRCQGAMHS